MQTNSASRVSIQRRHQQGHFFVVFSPSSELVLGEASGASGQLGLELRVQLLEHVARAEALGARLLLLLEFRGFLGVKALTRELDLV